MQMRVAAFRFATFIGLSVVAIVAAPFGFAQENSAAQKGKTLLTPDAALRVRSISDLQFSPDGSRLALVVAEPPKDKGRARHIWLYDQGTSVVRQFTFSAKSESAPRWSPDGRCLAFLSNREGDQQQIYLVRANGGEGVAITKGKRSVKSFEWSPDGKHIAFLAPDAKTDTQEKKEKDNDDAHVVDKEDKRARVWLLDVPSPATVSSDAANHDARAMSKPTWNVDALAWMPSGEQLILQATDRPESDQHTEKIYSMQLSDGALKALVAPRGPFFGIRVSPDGKGISYVGAREDGPSPTDLMVLPIGAPAARNLTGASLDRPVQEHHWVNGSVLLLVQTGFTTSLVSYSEDASRHDLALTPAPTGSMSVSASGDIAFVSQSGIQQQEVWLWNQKAAPQQLSHFNDEWKQFSLSAPEYYKYKSFDGNEIEAALLKPAGADPKAKLPLIALIHGGPTGRWNDAIESWGQLLVARGYAIFYPNIRGSVGYGQKFVESNRGDWGGGDFKDVMAGVKDLIDRGIADPNRLGIGGWSYGGYMAEWAITQTNSFKAAVSGAGMANLISEFGTEDHPQGDEWFYGVPWEKPEGFLNSSPFLHLKDAKTPTLVLQGDADTVDPLGQSQELYRGLKRYGVESELVVYPREPHGFQEEKHLLDRLNRILAWYAKYLPAK
jgi:dipeptidyl aminopeptidase/acylaminoacyl peptidase